MPVYGWVKFNLEKQISSEFGSVEAFEDKYEFDLAHLFGGPYPYHGNVMEKLRAAHDGQIEPSHLLEVDMPDPDDMSTYAEIIAGIKHHKEQRGRFVYVQTPGLFEILNDPFQFRITCSTCSCMKTIFIRCTRGRHSGTSALRTIVSIWAWT